MPVFLTGGTEVWVGYLCHVPHHNGSRPHLDHEVKVYKKTNSSLSYFIFARVRDATGLGAMGKQV